MPTETTDVVKLLGDKTVYQTMDTETNLKPRTSRSKSRSSRAGEELMMGATAYATSDEDVFETREVVKEGDKKKVTYTRKISVHDGRKDDKHCHSNAPTRAQDKKSRNKLIIASVLCLLFMTVEIVGGILAGSLAIISDAAHLLTDFASFMISLVALYLASRPATQRFNYGWHRTEILGAFASIIMLWILTGVLAYEAVMRIVKNNYSIDSKIMLITAAIGVAFNIILATTLHQHSHSHGGGGHGHSHGGHGHSHGGGQGHNNRSSNEGQGLVRPSNESSVVADGHSYGSIAKGNSNNSSAKLNDAVVTVDTACGDAKAKGKGQKKEKNINVKAAFVHVVGDLLQSFGVLVAAFIIYFKPEWKIADPICTFFFSIIVVFTTISIMRDIIVVLMEGKPRSISFMDVRETLLAVSKVKDTHNLRMWSLTMDKVALSVHLVVEEECDARDVLRDASTAMRDQFNIVDMTIQIEEYVEDMDNCNECIGPS